MADQELQARLTAYAETFAASTHGPDPAAVRRRGRRRAHRRVAVAAVAVVAIATISAGLVSWLPTRPGGDGAVPAFRPAGREPGEPRTFLGIGRNGRVAVVETATGRPRRYLTPPLVRIPVLDAAHGIVYYADNADACGNAFHQVDVATGKVRPFLPGERFVEALAISPDRTRIAFARAVAQESGSGDAVSVDCHDGELVVVDLRTNTRRVWTVPNSSLTDLDWSPDGTQLAYGLQTRDVGANTARAYLLDLTTANGPRLAGRLLAAPGQDCQLLPPRFQPGSDRVVVGSTCQRNHDQLLAYDRHSGRLAGRTTLASGQTGGILQSIAFDASGTHLLFTLARRHGKAEAWVLRGDRAVIVSPDCDMADW